MSGELTLLILRLVFLAVMWIFVFSIIYALRSDLFGSRSRDYQRALEQSKAAQQAAEYEAQQAQQMPRMSAPVASAAAAPVPAPAVSAPAAAPAAATVPHHPAPGQPSQPGQPGQASANGEADAPAEFTKIVITSGPRRGSEVPLTEGPLLIGRSPDANLRLQDDYTSTRHARLLKWHGAWVVQDLDSTNGTFVDDERVSQPATIRRGTKVRIGTTTFELR